jgi:hypothetical protein
MAVAPSGAIGMTQEIMALRKSITEGLQIANQPLLVNIRQTIQRQDTLQMLWDEAGYAFGDRWDAANVRQTALASCQQVTSLLRKSSHMEALAYKEFVYTTALKVAEAAKEEGFMSIGGVAITSQERALLNEIARALGVQQ